MTRPYVPFNVPFRAGTEHAQTTIDLEFRCDRPAHDNKRGDVLVGCLYTAQIECRVDERTCRRQHHRKIRGPAARHDGIDRDLLDRGDTGHRIDFANDMLRGIGREANGFFYASDGWDDDWQAVGPAA